MVLGCNVVVGGLARAEEVAALPDALGSYAGILQPCGNPTTQTT